MEINPDYIKIQLIKRKNSLLKLLYSPLLILNQKEKDRIHKDIDDLNKSIKNDKKKK